MSPKKREYPEILTASLEYYPLSFQQERIWYLSQLAPESTVWNRLSCKYLQGKIDIDRLRQAVADLTKRHCGLKTRVILIQNTPYQKPVDLHSDYFQTIERLGPDKTDWDKEVQNLLNQEVATAIDVHGDQLFWAKLIILSETDFVLFFKLHHIISDATTFQIMWRDLKSIYNSATNADPVNPPAPLRYYDYAIWQRQLADNPLIKEEESYWLDKFQGDIPLLNLPTDFPADSQFSYRGAMEREWIPRDLTRKLFTFSLKKQVILFSTLLSAYYVLLYQYCRQEDLVVGTVFSGRHYQNALNNLLGFFVNTVAIRAGITGETNFEELLSQIHHQINEAYLMQDFPFERLIQKINPERSRKGNPLFRTAFNMVSQPKESIRFAGIEEEKWVEPEVNSAQFDLTLDILNQNSENIEVRFEYNTGLFKRETIQRLLRNYIDLLGRIVNQSRLKVKELICLNAQERELVLYEWNHTKAAYSSRRCIHELFEKQVESTPEAVALIYEGQTLTYTQLNQKANQLAGLLRDQGVEANTFVGVLLDRSFEMVIAVMGILKAGGAYAPFEPYFPDSRIKRILRDLNARWIITQQKYGQRVRELQDGLSDDAEPILLDRELRTRAGAPNLPEMDGEADRTDYDLRDYPDHNPGVKVSPEDVAYVIYTSGSTGVPKGVVVKHKPVINLIEWVNQTFRIAEQDKLLFITSLCFDLSVYDIFGILAAGGSIRIVSNNDTRNPERLLEMINHENITFWDSAPAALQQLIPILTHESFEYKSGSLRLVFLSGDWIPVTLPDLLKAKFPKVQVISLGGATEATVWSNYYPIQAVDPLWVSIPYGKPIQNAKYYVLDPDLSPCPIGVPGDLYIGGECLSSGYVNDPVLSAAKFLKNPFEESPTSFIYKTGDFARWFTDGNLEFLGRKDHQVKIRGFRIELGEIDSHLLRCPGMKEAIVIARESAGVAKEKYLCAYYVSEQNYSANKLREILAQELPEYMIPSYFVQLDKLPMTSNGKIDRRALPEPDKKIQTSIEYTAPRTTMESNIVEIWKEILKVDRISIHDNFFELGGHSLLATQLILKMREALQVNIPLGKILDFPSVVKLSDYIEKNTTVKNIKGKNEHSSSGEREIGKI